MKRFLLLLFVGASSIHAQTPCESGRYAEDVFANFVVTSDIEYGSNTNAAGNTTTLLLDFYEPENDTETERPLLIWVHGGSFLAGSKTDIDVKTFSERFAKKGYACASINYRLGFFPIDSTNAIKAVVRAVQDLKAAIRFFRQDNATTNTYKIDPNRIYIGGSSAGAITALHVAYLSDECEIEDYLDASALSALGGLEGTSGNPGYSTEVSAVINGCGALGRYSWMEAGEVPLCSIHGTNDGTVKYNRGLVNPGIPIMYLDGSRMLHERACAIGTENSFYTFHGAPHVPYAGTGAAQLAYMDTTVNFIRDFLVKQLGCTETELQPANNWAESAYLYPIDYCDGSPVNEVCPLAGLPTAELTQWNMYPNPASNQVTIDLEATGSYSVAIYDLTGRIVYRSKVSQGAHTIATDLFNSGNYFVRITDQQTSLSETKKLIIQ